MAELRKEIADFSEDPDQWLSIYEINIKLMKEEADLSMIWLLWKPTG